MAQYGIVELNHMKHVAPQGASTKAKAGGTGAKKTAASAEETKPLGDPVGRMRAAKQADPTPPSKPAAKSKKKVAEDSKPKTDVAGRTRAAKPAAEAKPAKALASAKGKKRLAEPVVPARVTRARGN